MIYHAIFQSHLDYGCMLWTNTKKSNLTSITKLQMKALKSINHGKRTSFTAEKILNIENLKYLALHKFMHRIHKKSTSKNIQSFFPLNSTIHNYRTRQSNAPHIQKFKYQQTINSFLHQGPFNWISLPLNTHNLTPASFKNRVKNILLGNQ